MTPTAPAVPREASSTEEARFEKQTAPAAERPVAEQTEPAPHAPVGLPEFMPFR
jgi:hypothetical protein